MKKDLRRPADRSEDRADAILPFSIFGILIVGLTLIFFVPIHR